MAARNQKDTALRATHLWGAARGELADFREEMREQFAALAESRVSQVR